MAISSGLTKRTIGMAADTAILMPAIGAELGMTPARVTNTTISPWSLGAWAAMGANTTMLRPKAEPVETVECTREVNTTISPN